MESLDVFVSYLTLLRSFHMMYVLYAKFYMHDNLTAAGNFRKFLPRRIQIFNAVDIFQF